MNTVRSGRLRRLVWLASWPKSGNTWLRCLLANLLSESNTPILPDALGSSLPGDHAANRQLFDTLAGIPSSDCTDDEAESLRPAVYRFWASEAAKTNDRFLFSKTHDAFHDTVSGEPLFPPDVTAGAVYLLRNPLDVAVSFAFHSGHECMSCSSVDVTNPQVSLTGFHNTQVRQRVMDWAVHVESWVVAPFPVLVLRYEDLLADTLQELAKVVRFLELDDADDQSRLQRAVEFSTFARMRKAEEEHGFRENSISRRRFFRSGRVGDWRHHLTMEQARTVLESCGRVMSAFGYDCEALLDEVRGAAAEAR